MTLSGKLFIEGKLIKETEISIDDAGMSFVDKLEGCLIGVCSQFDIPVPLWLKKNTRELGIFRRTFFSGEQFIDKVWFDKFEIKLVA